MPIEFLSRHTSMSAKVIERVLFSYKSSVVICLSFYFWNTTAIAAHRIYGILWFRHLICYFNERGEHIYLLSA